MRPSMIRRLLVVFAFVLTANHAFAQASKYAPPKVTPPDSAIIKAIEGKSAELGQQIASLRRQGIADVLLADVEVYQNAAENIVRHNEFFQKDSPAWTLEVLDKGLLRARLLSVGAAPWTT